MNNLDNKLGDNKKLVDDYLKNLQDFIETHHQDKEVYDDIKEMIYEKLSKKDTISKADVKNILKEIGTPQDIFNFEIDDEKDISGLKFYEKFQKSGTSRDNKNAIFLGISSILAQKLEIHIFWVRIIWIVLIFPFGFGIGLYLLAGWILPIRDKDYKHISIGKYLWVQIWTTLSDLIKNTIKSIYLLPLAIFKFIKISWRFFINHIWSIIAKFAYAFFALIFVGMLIGFITLLAFKFGHFTIANYEILALTPQTLIWGVIFGAIWSFIFMIFFIHKIFGKIKMHIGLFYTGIAIVFVSLFLGITGGVELFGRYNGVQNITISESIDISSIDEEVVNINIFPSWYQDSFFRQRAGVQIELSDDDNITIENNKKLFISNKEFDKLKGKISPIEIKVAKKDTIIINQVGNNDFNSIVPYIFIEDEVTLYLPKNFKYNINGYIYLINDSISQKYDYLSDYIGPYCFDKEMYYSEYEGRFVCDLDSIELLEAENNYIKKKLKENFDDISTITHKDEYKNNYGYGFDWDLREVEFIENTIYFTISDMSLILDAKVDYNLDDETKEVTFDNFEIKKIVDIDKYFFDEIYYEDLGGIIED